MTSPTTLVTAENVESGYGSIAIVGPTGFTLRAGEALAVAGPNGSGKSTLLRTLLGRQTALSGLTYFDGGLLDESRANVRRAVASVFDGNAYLPELTVREHLEMVALAHAVTDPAVIDRELEFFDLEALADRFPEVLSSGQRRRFLLSAAFLRPFRLLILDEPEQRLDATMRARLTERLANLRGVHLQAPAILFVTHDPTMLTSVATSALYLEDTQLPIQTNNPKDAFPERGDEPLSANDTANGTTNGSLGTASSRAVPVSAKEAAEHLTRERA